MFEHNPEGEEVMQNYRKKNVQPMRPYIVGENLTGISVNKEDTPEKGGMIAVNPKNPEDRWYVAKKFFRENYELAKLPKPSGEAKQMTVESLEQIIAFNVPIEFIQVVEPFKRAEVYKNLATALYEAVYGGRKE